MALAIIGIKVWYIDAFNATRDQAGIVAIRELVIKSAEQTKTDAVRDPKTGDIYFPEAKLYLPVQNVSKLTYNVIPGNEHTDLTVSSSAVFNQMAAELYSTSNMEEMFKRVPHMQACSRGVEVMHTPLAASELEAKEQVATVQLNNGKAVHIYTERACPELKSTAEALKQLRSY